MPRIADIAARLNVLSPSALAEEWDNVGLLVGDAERQAERVMTCLTLTPASAAEAISQLADLVIAHHPLPFRPLKRLTTADTAGRMLWELIGAGVSIYSAHTAFDSAAGGINQQLAEGLGLREIAPLRPRVIAQQGISLEGLGAGRCGELPAPQTVHAIAARLKELLAIDRLQLVGEPERAVQRVAVACGSAGEFLADARRAGCDLFITGETNFHTCLEAEGTGVALLLTGHYASERFAMERLADSLRGDFPDCTIWASREERDPLVVV